MFKLIPIAQTGQSPMDRHADLCGGGRAVEAPAGQPLLAGSDRRVLAGPGDGVLDGRSVESQNRAGRGSSATSPHHTFAESHKGIVIMSKLGC